MFFRRQSGADKVVNLKLAKVSQRLSAMTRIANQQTDEWTDGMLG